MSVQRHGGMITDWLLPPMPLARLARLRTIIYLFVLIDVLAISHDVISHGSGPELYRPLLLARVLHLPPVSVPVAWVLLVVIILAAVLAALGIAQRISGTVVALAFGTWMLYSQGYGYVSHDHLALMIATLVLPTAGIATHRDRGTSAAAGWAIRTVQLAVVATYFLSVLAKGVESGSPIAWANSAVFAFAFIRRGSPLVTWMLELPWLFRPAQWALLLLELATPLALFLRGRALYAMVGVFLAFHTATFLALGIHFLPTVICWAAFLPLERWHRRPGASERLSPAARATGEC